MSDVKHRKYCAKFVELVSKSRNTVFSEYLVSHYSIKRYVDVVIFSPAEPDSLDPEHRKECYHYVEIKHDLAFDLGEELRKAADVKKVHQLKGNGRAIYSLVLPESCKTVDWVDNNAWYLFGSEINCIMGFNPEKPVIFGDRVAGSFGMGTTMILVTSGVHSPLSRERFSSDLYHMRELILARNAGERYGISSLSDTLSETLEPDSVSGVIETEDVR